MLNRDDFHAAIDEASRELTKEFPKQGGHIASLGAALKELLRNVLSSSTKQQATSVAQLFDICLAIDGDHAFAPHPVIAKAVDAKRAEALQRLLHLFYNRQIAEDNEGQVRIQREHALVQRIAVWLPQFRAGKPQGSIGPAWFKEHCDTDFWHAIQWHVYDAESQSDRWNHFTDLLPGDVRDRFDVSLIPMDIPETIHGKGQALSLLRQLAKHRGKTLEEITDPKNFDALCRTEPAFRKIVEFFRTLPSENENG